MACVFFNSRYYIIKKVEKDVNLFKKINKYIRIFVEITFKNKKNIIFWNPEINNFVLHKYTFFVNKTLIIIMIISLKSCLLLLFR